MTTMVATGSQRPYSALDFPRAWVAEKAGISNVAVIFHNMDMSVWDKDREVEWKIGKSVASWEYPTMWPVPLGAVEVEGLIPTFLDSFYQSMKVPPAVLYLQGPTRYLIKDLPEEGWRVMARAYERFVKPWLEKLSIPTLPLEKTKTPLEATEMVADRWGIKVVEISELLKDEPPVFYNNNKYYWGYWKPGERGPTPFPKKLMLIPELLARGIAVAITAPPYEKELIRVLDELRPHLRAPVYRVKLRWRRVREMVEPLVQEYLEKKKRRGVDISKQEVEKALDPWVKFWEVHPTALVPPQEVGGEVEVIWQP